MDESISNTPQDSGADDRETLLREMIVRLVTFPGDPRVSNPQVLVGQVPEGLPEEIPLPEQSRVVGTLNRGPENASIVIDANQPPAQVLDFYRESMQGIAVLLRGVPGHSATKTMNRGWAALSSSRCLFSTLNIPFTSMPAWKRAKISNLAAGFLLLAR